MDTTSRQNTVDTAEDDTSRASAAWPVERLTPWVLAPAIVMVTVLLAYAGRYGFHRDELYFIESMRHPSWGYVDNPSLTPALGWLSRQLFGDSLVGLRVVPALEVGLLVVVVAALARELGADRRAQVLAAVVAATSSFFLAVGHLLTTPTFDVLVTALVLLGLIRIVRTGEQFWWLAVGLMIGLGLENKYTLLLVLAALAVAALLTGAWRGLLSWWTLAGVVIAVVVWAPQLGWQIDHSWPQIEFARTLAEDEGGENRATLIPFQLLIVGPPLVPVVLAGLWALWSRPSWRPVRFLALGYVVVLLALLVTGGKGYYSAGLFSVIVAAGAIATNDWLGRGRSTVRWAVLVVGIVANVGVGSLITLPILPVSAVDGPIGAVNEDALETVGWPNFVEQVAESVPEGERDDVVILAANYGIAGAIDRFGSEWGLDQAYSGHNSYADFRVPQGSSGPVLLIDLPAVAASGLFEQCTEVADIDTIEGIENDVDGASVLRCERPSEPWSELWPKLRHYG